MINKICKVIIAMILIYLSWFQYIFGIYSTFLYGSTIILTVLVILDNPISLKIKIKRKPNMLATYIVFFIYSLLTGLVLTSNLSHFATMIIQYFGFVVICFDCYYISQKDGTLSWIMPIFVICAIMCSLQVIFRGYSGYRTAGVMVTTMSSSNNPNSLALTMILGIIGCLYDYDKLSQKFVVNTALIALFSYCIVLSGSRKAFIALALMVVLWVLLFLFSLRENEKVLSLKRVGIIISIFIIVLVAFSLLSSSFSNTALYTKLYASFVSGTAKTDGRLDMYLKAFDLFKESPLFGIGFREFEIQSGYGRYSHSTYAELLSCSGIIGTCIFLIPIVSLLVYLVRGGISNKGKIRYYYSICTIFLLIEIFYATGDIWMYDIGHLLLLLYISLDEQQPHILNRIPDRQLTL